MKSMAHAIKVDSPFVTALDTADALGVSRSRANTLIERVRKILFPESASGQFIEVRRKRRSANGTRKSRPNGASKNYQAKSKRAKAKG